MSIEFTAYPKTPRLFRDIVITEKIDGTNAAVGITGDGAVYAQSRNRIITPEDDNFGFARWVADNAGALTDVLGPGLHFGEWWGSGIQRGYGLEKGDKRFSLFNVKRWAVAEEDLAMVPGLAVVPVVYEGAFSEHSIRLVLATLQVIGSLAAPGFRRPEGIIVFHSAANQAFKVLVVNDDQPKSLVEAVASVPA